MKEISILDIAKLFLKKLWFLFIIMCVSGAVAFSYTKFAVPVQYRATAYLYVSSDGIVGKATSGDLSIAKMILPSYISILKMDGTLSAVAQESGLDIKNEYLRSMISYANTAETMIINISVTSDKPEEALQIANAICKVAPTVLYDTAGAGTVRTADEAHTAVRVGPNITRNTAIGMLVGLILAAGLILLREMLDQTIQNEADITGEYDIPMLGIVPDFAEKGKGEYYHYA